MSGAGIWCGLPHLSRADRHAGRDFLGGPGGPGGDVVCMFDPFFSSFFGGGGSQLHSNIMSRQLADS